MSSQAGMIAQLIVAVVLATGVLLALVAWSKWRRDRAERASALFRAQVAQAWMTSEAEALLAVYSAAATGRMQAQADLLAVVRGLEREQVDVDARQQEAWRIFRDSPLQATLVRQARDRSTVRRGLTAALGGLRSTRLPVSALVELLNDSDPTVRLTAASALEAHGTADAATALIAALVDDRLEPPRAAERLGHPWAVDTILACIEDVPPSTQQALADALGLACDPRSLPLLIDLAESTLHDEVALHASRAMITCAPRAAAGDVPRLRGYARVGLEDRRPVVRASAAAILGAMGRPEDVAVLTAHVGDPDWFVRRQAADALIAAGPIGAQALLEVAQGTDTYAAARARQALATEGVDATQDAGGDPWAR
jgi:hypothetical protein